MHTTASVNVTILEITIFKTFFLEFCGLKCKTFEMQQMELNWRDVTMASNLQWWFCPFLYLLLLLLLLSVLPVNLNKYTYF